MTLLEAIDAKEADVVRVSLDELSRSQYEKGLDQETAAVSNILDAPKAGLKSCAKSSFRTKTWRLGNSVSPSSLPTSNS